jgi:hypothetical protein
MSVYRTKQLLISLIVASPLLAWPAFEGLAQNSANPPVSDHEASFLTPEQAAPPTVSVPAFSGLALEPPTSLTPPPTATPITPTSAAPVVPTPAATAPATPTDIIAQPVSAAPLPNVSPESIGMQNANNLGADMWKGTSQSIATALLAIEAPTRSPVLNDLAKRLLTTAAVPPEGTAPAVPSLTSLRIGKLVAFGAAADAWALAKLADAKLVDDVTLHDTAENLLATDGEDLCGQMPDLAKNHAGADWQKALIVCQFRAKDTKAAQVALDVMRTQPNHDSIFLEIADKNLLSNDKNLPFQLTPLTAANLALLRMTGMPLPGELYGHPDLSLAPALMHTTTKQDVAQLGLAEHAAERGLISAADLTALYRNVVFTPDELAAPLTAHETGLRERALFFRAAENEKDVSKRIAYAIQFTQSASPAFLNGAGTIAADMLGAIKPDPAMQENAATIAWIYMLAGRGDAALDWLKLARSSTANTDILQRLWPQFTLAGLEADSDYAADLDKWLTAALTPASAQDDPHVARDAASSILLLLDAAGFKVPDAAWAKVIMPSHNEKHVAFSPLLFDRLTAAGIADKRAETILLAVGLANDSEISLPAAIAITRALREAGFKNEAAIFARQMAALPTKQN